MITVDSPHGHAETMRRLHEAIEARGITIFATIDHAGAAREAGLELADEQVLVFGNPKAGTLLMQDDPAVGIELPLKILCWDSHDGVRAGYNDPTELASRYDVGAHAATLEAMSHLLAELVTEATSR